MTGRRRLHFHSDSSFFAGSERGMPLLWSSPILREQYDITFSYRTSSRYDAEVLPLVPNGVGLFPLHTAPTNREPTASALDETTFKRKVSAFTSSVMDLALRYPRFARDVWQLRRILKSASPDVLHLNNGGYPGSRSVRAGAVAARLCRVRRVVMVVNNQAIPYASIGRRMEFPVDRLVCRSTHAFVTASAAARDRLISVLALPASRVHQIPNAVEEPTVSAPRAAVRQALGSDEASTVISVTALLEPRKGQVVLIDAVDRLRNMDTTLASRLVVWLIGDGPDRYSLEEHVQRLGLQDQIHFLGYRHDYVDLMAASDLVVLTSLHSEDSPLATLEAMSLGLPVIASSIAGLAEQVVDGVTGFSVPPGDVAELADRLELLLRDPARGREMGTSARRRYEQEYSPESFIARYEALYDASS